MLKWVDVTLKTRELGN